MNFNGSIQLDLSSTLIIWINWWGLH